MGKMITINKIPTPRKIRRHFFHPSSSPVSTRGLPYSSSAMIWIFAANFLRDLRSGQNFAYEFLPKAKMTDESDSNLLPQAKIMDVSDSNRMFWFRGGGEGGGVLGRVRCNNRSEIKSAFSCSPLSFPPLRNANPAVIPAPRPSSTPRLHFWRTPWRVDTLFISHPVTQYVQRCRTRRNGWLQELPLHWNLCFVFWNCSDVNSSHSYFFT